MFVGFSEVHSSLVPLVLNVRTGKISPQYHVIFEDKFETVHSLPQDEYLPSEYENILHLDSENFLYEDGYPIVDQFPPADSEYMPR